MRADNPGEFSLEYKGCFQDTQFSKALRGGTKVFTVSRENQCDDEVSSTGSASAHVRSVPGHLQQKIRQRSTKGEEAPQNALNRESDV